MKHSMKVGVIGAGHWGKNLVRNFAELGVLAGVADPVEENRLAASQQAPGIELFDNEADLLAAGYDAVAIATPAATHYRIAQRALEVGLDVFVEKPVTLDAAEALELNRMAEQGERILMVGHLLLYQPAVNFIVEFLRVGKLGQVYTLHQRRSKLGRVRSEENVMWSFGAHDVAVLLVLAGESPDQIQAWGHAAINSGVEDDTYLHLGFPSGLKASLHNSWLWPRVERELIIVGEKGMMVFEESGSRVVLHRKVVDSEGNHHDGGEEILFEGSAQPLLLELEHFLECCRERQRPISDGRNGYEVVRVLEESGRQLSVET